MNRLFTVSAFLLLSCTSNQEGHLPRNVASSDTISATAHQRDSISDTTRQREPSPKVDPLEELFAIEGRHPNEVDAESYSKLDTLYNLDGSVWKTGRYTKGRKTGEWIEYDMEGRLYARRYYKNGLPFGVWKFYDEKGNVVRSDEQPDTLHVLYTFPLGDYRPVVIKLTADGYHQQTEVWEEDIHIEMDTLHKHEGLLFLKKELFTGLYVQHDVPTATWGGIVAVRDGRIRGENIRYGWSNSSYVDNVRQGKEMDYQFRYGPVYSEGYYRNNEKEGRWNYYVHIDSTGDIEPPRLLATITYQRGKVKNMVFIDDRGRKTKDSTIIRQRIDFLKENSVLGDEETE